MPRVGIFPPLDGLLDAVKATSGASSAACGAFSLMRATGLIAVTVAILALIPVLLAQEAVAPYCSDLKRATDLAMTNERFASISAKSQDGDFADTNLALTDWNDCSVYAGRIYTCDSRPITTAQEAEQVQRKISHQIQSCLGASWVEEKDRSSFGFIRLRHVDQPISMTLSLDETDQKEYLVRLILFGRSN